MNDSHFVSHDQLPMLPPRSTVRHGTAEPYVILLLTISVLSLLSDLPLVAEWRGLKIKSIDLFSDLRDSAPGPIPTEFLLTEADALLAQAALPPPAPSEMGPFLPLGRTDLPDIKNDQIVDMSATNTALMRFQAALKNSDRALARIAYFGDSAIEGDLVTEDLRAFLQARFGGSGLGLLPIIASAWRKTVSIGHSEGWQTYSLIARSPEVPLGVAGLTFVPDSDSGTSVWSSFHTRSTQGDTMHPILARLFYGSVRGRASVNVRLNGVTKPKGDLIADGAAHALAMGTEQPFSDLTLTFRGVPSIYGLSLDSTIGVQVDNFGFRSQAGFGLMHLSTALMNQLNTELHYDLIVLQYGLNVSNPTMKNFDWYQKRMVETIVHMQRCFPTADVLLIGVGDNSVHDQGRIVSNPALPALIQAQALAARETGIAFWNLQEAMGGPGSMVQWVKNGWARKDYKHFRGDGAKRVAELLMEALMHHIDAHAANP